MEECGGVHIHFPVEGSGSDTVVIRGPASDVEKAKKQLLHLAEEKVGLKPILWHGDRRLPLPPQALQEAALPSL